MKPLIPGAREPGMLTRFAALVPAMEVAPNAPSSMDAATVADRQREGGGAPNQRWRPLDATRRKGLRQRLQLLLTIGR